MNDFGQLAPHALSEKLRAAGCKNAFTAAWQSELATSREPGTGEEHGWQAFPTSLPGLGPSGFHIPSLILLQRQYVPVWVSRGQTLCFLLADSPCYFHSYNYSRGTVFFLVCSQYSHSGQTSVLFYVYNSLNGISILSFTQAQSL